MVPPVSEQTSVQIISLSTCQKKHLCKSALPLHQTNII
uniref:Uncharacterized protein n=1 Tax=Anguilla anguilla TaxID=7936 RepID=A0A0E9XW07_ANGAN